VTLQARSGRFYRIQEQWWEDELVSIWTDVTDVISRKRALQQAHSELSALNRQLVELSETDSLTGLANRRRFGVQLERAQQAVVEGAQAAVAIFDLDFFKAVNDRYGHDAGDVVLVEAAKMLQVHQGDDICVARLGGEEFGMVFRGMEVAKVLAVCEELRRAFSQGHFRIGAQRLRVTVSVGVAPLTEYRNQSVSLKKADDSLWKAKSAGRDCVMFELSWPHVRDGGDDLQVVTDIRADDEPLSPEALREKYALPVNQHPVFTRPHWQEAVRRRETVDDYWGWVSYKIEARSQDQ
jgi:diguanylate cyclase (GGDEF)-like protein